MVRCCTNANSEEAREDPVGTGPSNKPTSDKPAPPKKVAAGTTSEQRNKEQGTSEQGQHKCGALVQPVPGTRSAGNTKTHVTRAHQHTTKFQGKLGFAGRQQHERSSKGHWVAHRGGATVAQSAQHKIQQSNNPTIQQQAPTHLTYFTQCRVYFPAAAAGAGAGAGAATTT